MTNQFIENKHVRKVQKFDVFCFWFMTVDILFLPYLPHIAVSVSVIVAVIWAILNLKHNSYDREWTLFGCMVAMMIVGTVMNVIYEGAVRFETSLGTAIKRLFQYVICFYYYFFYKYYFANKKVNMVKIVFAGIIFMAIMATLFRLFPHEYAVLKLSIHPADNHTRRYLANIVQYRFNYFWTDPNNISYLIAGIFTWFCLQKTEKNIIKALVIILSTFIALCTVSNGGLIVLLTMMLIIIAMGTKRFIDSFFIVKNKTLLFIVIVLVLGAGIVYFTSIGKFVYENYLVNFIDRIEVYMNVKSGLSGGRLEDLKYGLSIISPITLIMGTGQEGIVTEIGHLYWIGMYGLPAYLIFIYIMFRKKRCQSWRTYIWVIPFFIGFTMNIAIGEFKWMAVYLMLLAYSRSTQNGDLEEMAL